MSQLFPTHFSTSRWSRLSLPLFACLAFGLAGCESVPEVDESGTMNPDNGDGDGDGDDPVKGKDDIDPLGTGGKGGDGDGDGDGDGLPDPVCGNGKLEVGELCDDGNTKNDDGCSKDCSEVHPDYLCLEEGEACERVVTCGNGVLEGDEVCDDKNTNDGDGCAADCSEVEEGYSCIKPGVKCVGVPVCGNGIRERGEQCDDGQEVPESGDGCDDECQQEEGYFCPPGEECVEMVCGDGNRTPDEQCDDGPGELGSPGTPQDGDGCSADCTIEEGWRCSASGCRAICGNGLLQDGEECDDGDVESGDGCSAACFVEPYTTCSGEPSVCTSTVVCGDGKVDPGEVCDPAVAGQSACYNPTDHPGQACKGFDKDLVDPPDCGNHVIELDEECDGGTGCDPVTCLIEDGYACPKADYCFRLPECGDGEIQAGETCDAGAVTTLGCNACKVVTDYYCSGEPSVCVASVCGDGLVAPDEQCDDGPSTPKNGDGCSAACEVEDNWICPPGAKCIADCGDGVVVAGQEECDDAESPSACTNCRINPGWDCTNGRNCFQSVCGNNQREKGEGCDDGNKIAGDGCGPTCQLEPTITRDAPDYEPEVQLTCGDGLQTGDEECDDGNLTDGDGCNKSCDIEPGWYCDPVINYEPYFDFKITYRDFKSRDYAGGHPQMLPFHDDTPSLLGEDMGIVGTVCTVDEPDDCGRLDQNGKPVYDTTASNPTVDPSGDNLSATYHRDAFALFYTDNPSLQVNDRDSQVDGNTSTNVPIDYDIDPATNPTPFDTLRLTRIGTSTAYEFESADNDFYPLNGRGFGNGFDRGASNRNFNFTSELRYFFQYQGGETLTFFGDDDVWVFVNGRLAVDIGGIHTTRYGRVILGDDGADGAATESNCSVHLGGSLPSCSLEASEDDGDDKRFDLTVGGVYEIVVFQAERSPTESNYRLTLDGFIAPRSNCYTECGDGRVAGAEICDDGPNMPTSGYKVCLRNICRYTFCGDGVRNGNEQCDNGTNADTYDDGQTANPCAPGCLDPGFCGDDIVQSAFEVCDDGENDGSYGGCDPGCQGLAGYCGDGTTDAPYETCDTPGEFNNYEFEEGGCGYDCQPASYCGDEVRNGPELCDVNNPLTPNCNDTCEFAPYCGDGLVSIVAGEDCDYGAFAFEGDPEDAPYGSCTDECEFGPHCGDGTIQAGGGEECDNGEDNMSGVYDECADNCLLGPRCGDGVLQDAFGEACDNGFNDDEYAHDGAVDPCGDDCKAAPSCGDGVVQSAYELCDDGDDNADDAYDGCTEQCDWGPYCGDGVKNGPEKCDNGTKNVAYSPDGKGCSYDCKDNVPYCGDGVRNGPEECDKGEDNADEYGACQEDCKLGPRCGDGKVQKDEGEACDDGPSGSLSCTPTCKVRDTEVR